MGKSKKKLWKTQNQTMIYTCIKFMNASKRSTAIHHLKKEEQKKLWIIFLPLYPSHAEKPNRIRKSHSIQIEQNEENTQITQTGEPRARSRPNSVRWFFFCSPRDHTHMICGDCRLTFSISVAHRRHWISSKVNSREVSERSKKN